MPISFVDYKVAKIKESHSSDPTPTQVKVVSLHNSCRLQSRRSVSEVRRGCDARDRVSDVVVGQEAERGDQRAVDRGRARECSAERRSDGAVVVLEFDVAHGKQLVAEQVDRVGDCDSFELADVFGGGLGVVRPGGARDECLPAGHEQVRAPALQRGVSRARRKESA